MAAATFAKGDKVAGLGRWRRKPVGTVTLVHGDNVRVQWDDCCVEDDMKPADLLRVFWSDTLGAFVTIPGAE